MSDNPLPRQVSMFPELEFDRQEAKPECVSRARVARFRVRGQFDGAKEATVEVDRSAGLITVRPLRRRTAYTLPFATVAESVVWRVVKAKVAERKKKKRS